MAIKISINNCKGGTGKSTTALILTTGLKLRINPKTGEAFRTLLIDLDQQRNSIILTGADAEKPGVFHAMMGLVKIKDTIQPTPLTDVIVSQKKLAVADLIFKDEENMEYILKNLISEIEDDYDFIVFDNAPGASSLMLNSLVASDYVILASPPELMSLQGIVDAEELISKAKKKYNENLSIAGILLTMFSKSNYSREVEKMLTRIATRLDCPVFDTKIRRGVAIGNAQAKKENLFTYKDTKNSNVAEDYNMFLDEFLAGVNING